MCSGYYLDNVNDVHILESLIVYVVDEKNVKMNQNC